MSNECMDLFCPHGNDGCIVVKTGTTPEVDLPNSFNLVMDADDATKCHVLQALTKKRRYTMLERLNNAETAIAGLYAIISQMMPPSIQDDAEAFISDFYEANESLGAEFRTEFYKDKLDNS